MNSTYLVQHCKPAVDDDTFQKMVDRQYELMRRPRMMDEMNHAKNPIRPDDVDMPISVNHPAPNAATEAPVSDHEVSPIVFECLRIVCVCVRQFNFRKRNRCSISLISIAS